MRLKVFFHFSWEGSSCGDFGGGLEGNFNESSFLGGAGVGRGGVGVSGADEGGVEWVE